MNQLQKFNVLLVIVENYMHEYSERYTEVCAIYLLDIFKEFCITLYFSSKAIAHTRGIALITLAFTLPIAYCPLGTDDTVKILDPLYNNQKCICILGI